ncbi:MAG: UDP-N-acetylmuramate dehydrogenase [Armatimonadetes bacterium]|nr:UDP-N-acetylmuramate dehydrogenase [Armatimonadota bacterium]
MEVARGYSLRQHNTFGVDAQAAFFARVQTPAELAALLEDPELRGAPRLVLGGGSNILFTRDFDGLVIENAIEGIRVLAREGDTAVVEAGAGVVWHDLVLFCVEHDLGGLENLALIPGRVGASPIQNVGAYGVEIKDVFESLEAMEIATGRVRTFRLEECRFGYRNSVFKQEAKGRYIILAVRFRLTTREHRLNLGYAALASLRPTPTTIRDVCEAVIAIRRSKLPDPAELGNAGSFFKNPEVSLEQYAALKAAHPGLVAYPSEGGMKLAAGWLIEQCGWKGKRVGNVGAHARQALVIVNYGGATGAEILDFARQVQASVAARFGVALQTEVNII